MPSSTSRQPDLADVLPRLTARDRTLLALLDEHLAMSTDQITRALFSSARMCQHRLHTLRQLEVLDRLTVPLPRPHGGTSPTLWTLGRLGLDQRAAATDRSATTRRAARQRLARLAERPDLAHLLGVNGLFCDLLAHARTHPGTRLTRWWSERTAQARFAWGHPDGHGIWRERDRTVGFFVEYDTGRENLRRLVAKLAAYEHLARDNGPAYPVLFSLHHPDREANLHAAIAGLASRCPVATTVRPTPDSAGPVWAVVGAGTTRRSRLSELDSDHGPDHPRNPNWSGGEHTDDITGDPPVRKPDR